MTWRLLPAGLAVLCAGVCAGQSYPDKPIRIVTGGVGGGSDFTARVIAAGLTNNIGQQVIVDNRSASVIPGQIVSKAPPDGYTLILAPGILWLLPFLQGSQVPFDPVRDFAPVTLAVTTPNVLVVNPVVAASSVKELIALAKAKPGELNYSSPGTASSGHLAAEVFKAMAHVNIVRVNYKSGGAALTDLLAAQVQLSFVTGPSVAPHIKSGRLRPLGVTSARPYALFPALPTVAAAGVPGFESGQNYAILAPANTPTGIIMRINQELVRVLNQPDIREKFMNGGAEIVASSPGQFAIVMKSEMTKLGKVIKDAGIRAD